MKKRWPKGIRRINIPTFERDPETAIAKTMKMDLPKFRKIAYELVHYVGKDGFNCYPNVYIERP